MDLTYRKNPTLIFRLLYPNFKPKRRYFMNFSFPSEFSLCICFKEDLSNNFIFSIKKYDSCIFRIDCNCVKADYIYFPPLFLNVNNVLNVQDFYFRIFSFFIPFIFRNFNYGDFRSFCFSSELPFPDKSVYDLEFAFVSVCRNCSFNLAGSLSQFVYIRDDFVLLFTKFHDYNSYDFDDNIRVYHGM